MSYDSNPVDHELPTNAEAVQEDTDVVMNTEVTQDTDVTMNTEAAQDTEESNETEPPNKVSELIIKAPVALIRQAPSEMAKILSFEKKGKKFEIPEEPINGWVPVLLPTGKTGWVISYNVEILE